VNECKDELLSIGLSGHSQRVDTSAADSGKYQAIRCRNDRFVFLINRSLLQRTTENAEY